MAQILLIIGSLIFGILGSIHLFYTFFTHKFDPRDIKVKHAMESTSPRLTQETSIWQGLVGFNASHSIGAILIALFFIPLSIMHNEIIQSSLWFSTLPAGIGISYLVLAVKYWFKVPTIGILLATLCFLGAAIAYNT